MQVYSQPLYANVENWLRFRFPDSGFVNYAYDLKLPLLPNFQLSPLRLCFRTFYVATTTVIAMLFPYFNQILGVLAGIIYYPLTIYFPVEMYISQCNIEPWTSKWIWLRTFSIVGFVVGAFTLIGSIQGIISAKLSWEAWEKLKLRNQIVVLVFHSYSFLKPNIKHRKMAYWLFLFDSKRLI